MVSILSLAADVASKSWAEHHLDGYPGTVEVWKNHLTLLLAKNRALFHFGLTAVLGEVACLSAAVVALPALLVAVRRLRKTGTSMPPPAREAQRGDSPSTP